MRKLLFAGTNARANLPYRWPVILAGLLHLLIFVLLVGSFFWSPPTSEDSPEQAIQATLVSSAQLTAMQASAVPIPKIPSPKIVAAPKPVPTPDEKAIALKAAAQKALEEKEKQQAQQKSLEESLLSEEMNQPPVPKNTADSQKQAALMDQQLQAEEMKQQAKMQSTLSSAGNKATQNEINKYKTIILQQIQQNWIVPQNVDHLSCLLKVRVAPGGMVLSVDILKSSGNDALDHSAVAAVNKASPLPVPTNSAAFEAFRTFTLTVKPEGSSLAQG